MTKICEPIVDLHTHSCCSDGSCTPAELVSLAAEEGLSAFALTDHDTTAGYDEAAAAAEARNKTLPEDQRLEVIPGVEISCAYKKRDIHILGLLIDPHDEPLNTLLQDAGSERDRRNRRMCDNLRAAGVPITYEELKATDPGAVITRAHFGRYLVNKRIVRDYPTAFERYLGDDTPFYESRRFTPPEDAIKAIRAAGGIPILAHPLIYHLGQYELDALIDRLAGYGLMGLEAIYVSHTKEDEQYVRSMAQRKKLLISGGSDFHGAAKPQVKIGVGRGNLHISYDVLDRLRDAQAKMLKKRI